jgi:purine-binding chemotaxis protein CheW
MAALSRLAARSAARAKGETQQLILFSLRNEWFALPIQAAHRVVPASKIHGTIDGFGMGLTRYQNLDIPVLDVAQRLFAEANAATPIASLPSADSAWTEPTEAAEQTNGDRYLDRYLLILQNLRGELIGIPIDSQPILRRVPRAAFTPVPPTYLNEGRIRCISALVTADQDNPPAFLLDLDQLFQAQGIAPSPLPPSLESGNDETRFLHDDAPAQ